MIYIKTEEEVEKIRVSSLLVSKTLAVVAEYIKPGVSLKKLDSLAEDFIKSHGALPAFKGYNGFPATLCISPNEQVVHGIPTEKELKDGDIVSVDCGVLYNGFYGDSAYTFCVGEVSDDKKKMLDITKESLYLGIEKAIEGFRVGDISSAIQSHCERNGYSVVRELVGHGVGKNLHESPEVPNYGKKGHGVKLKKGMVIAIEPMINMGSKNIKFDKDGWTVTTSDKKISAHYEHTIVIRENKAEILSNFAIIEEVLGMNKINF